MTDLGPLLRPASIALIGASATRDIIPGLPQRILAQHGYAGRVCPVNPKYDSIDGLPCYARVGDVPGPVDVALITVNAARVAAVVDECGRAGVKFAVIISSGFAEQADGGAERQEELRDVCRRHPALRVIGPNAEGHINVTDSIPVGFSPMTNYERGLIRLVAGDVAVVAHSGGLGFALFNDGLARGLGFSHVVTTGNEVDLDLADVTAHLLEEEDTSVILLFLEGVTDPARLTKLGESARAAGKHIVAAKVGATEAGRRAALAHTAHDTGDAAAYERALADGGIHVASDQEELVDLALAFSRTKPPAGPKVGIVTTSGGSGTWLADDIVTAGLELPVLSEGLQARIRERIPAYGSPANPVDATAQVLSQGGTGPVLRAVADSGEVDALVLIATLADGKQVEREQETLAELAGRIPLVVYSYTRPAPRSVELMEALGIAYFTSGRRTARALAALARKSLSGTDLCSRAAPSGILWKVGKFTQNAWRRSDI
ncbi:MAG: CoA-binding protein [Streptosporangiales bacterium]|nr:CoA-binding protein [Streptosporangiales bacterium]